MKIEKILYGLTTPEWANCAIPITDNKGENWLYCFYLMDDKMPEQASIALSEYIVNTINE